MTYGHQYISDVSENEMPLELKKQLLLHTDGYITLKSRRNGRPIKIKMDGKLKNVIISKFDVKDFSGLSDFEILAAIEKDTGEDITTSKGLKKINEFFEIAIVSFYEGSRRDKIFSKRGLTTDNIGLNIPFKNYQEVINFLKSIGTKRNEGRKMEGDLLCYITKVSSLVGDLINNELNELDKLEPELFEYLSNTLYIRPVGDIHEGRVHGRNFRLVGNKKEPAASISKGLSDPKYTELERIMDGIRYTFEVQSGEEKDMLFIFEKVINALIAKGGVEMQIKVKGFENLDLKGLLLKFLELNDSELEDSELGKLLGIKVSREIKNATSKSYEEIKATCKINGIGVEIKITKKGNKNQKGLNFSGIYKILNSDIEGKMMRHFQYCMTRDEIKDEADIFFESLEIFLEKNPETKNMTENDFKKDLWEDLQKKQILKTEKKFVLGGHIKLKEKQLKEYTEILKEGLTDYYISKLIDLGDGIYTSQRAQAINKEWCEDWKEAA